MAFAPLLGGAAPSRTSDRRCRSKSCYILQGNEWFVEGGSGGKQTHKVSGSYKFGHVITITGYGAGLCAIERHDCRTAKTKHT